MLNLPVLPIQCNTMSKKNEFEIRLSVIGHMSKMLLEMSEVDFSKLSKQDEQIMLEDFEEISGHLLDSLGFKPKNSENGVDFTADFTIIDPEEYIQNFLKNSEPI